MNNNLTHQNIYANKKIFKLTFRICTDNWAGICLYVFYVFVSVCNSTEWQRQWVGESVLVYASVYVFVCFRQGLHFVWCETIKNFICQKDYHSNRVLARCNIKAKNINKKSLPFAWLKKQFHPLLLIQYTTTGGNNINEIFTT